MTRSFSTPGGGTGFAPAGTRRRYLSALGATGLVGVTAISAACGVAGEGQAPAPQAAAPVTIEFMQNDSDSPTRPEGATRIALLDEFNQTNAQKITVNLEGGRASMGNDKLKSLAAAGTPPHLYYIAYYFAAEYYLAGMTVDVDTELKSDKEWARQRAGIFPPMLESSAWTGKLVSIPGYTNNQAVIYNTGLLQQAGVAPPRQGWTWDDFKVTAQKFVRPEMIPLSMGWGSTWRHWLGTAGAQPISKDAKRITFDTPEMLQVTELYLDLLKRGIALRTPDGKSGLFETYKLAKNDTVFEVQGPYRIPVIREANAPDFRTIHIPVHPGKRQVFAANGGHNLIVFKEVPAEKRAAAAQVAKWLNGPHAQAQMCIKAASIPVSKAALEARELQDYLKTDAAFKGFVDLAPQGWRWPTLPSYGKIWAVVDGAVSAILRQDVGIKAGLSEAQQQAQQLLDEDVRLMR
jgi:multiple sugar transport system substrate-binding protein